jgi:hypothetical protein
MDPRQSNATKDGAPVAVKSQGIFRLTKLEEYFRWLPQFEILLRGKPETNLHADYVLGSDTKEEYLKVKKLLAVTDDEIPKFDAKTAPKENESRTKQREKFLMTLGVMAGCLYAWVDEEKMLHAIEGKAAEHDIWDPRVLLKLVLLHLKEESPIEVSAVLARDKLHTMEMHRGESLDDYYARHDMQFKTCVYLEPGVVPADRGFGFVKGLDQKRFGETVREMKQANIYFAIQDVKTIKKQLADRLAADSLLPELASKPAQEREEELIERVAALTAEVSNFKKVATKKAKHNGRDEERVRSCKNCNSTKHYTRECKEEKTGSCNHCHAKGHWKTECPELKKKKKVRE